MVAASMHACHSHDHHIAITNDGMISATFTAYLVILLAQHILRSSPITDIQESFYKQGFGCLSLTSLSMMETSTVSRQGYNLPSSQKGCHVYGAYPACWAFFLGFQPLLNTRVMVSMPTVQGTPVAAVSGSQTYVAFNLGLIRGHS